jgi:hypothetical protein
MYANSVHGNSSETVTCFAGDPSILFATQITQDERLNKNIPQKTISKNNKFKINDI